MFIRVPASLFAQNLLDWYERFKRDLPWRASTDPYRVWLSEVILQQTRVAQGMSYFQAFAERFPTVFDLAEADEQEVLRLWEGLGYYSRARNMHAAARQVAEDFGGAFPDTIEGLRALKGVGPYTAAAIGSISFGLEEPALDGNAFRVASRFFGIDLPINQTEAKPVFYQVLKTTMEGVHPGNFNQAVMELGALVCTPVRPGCLDCPINHGCYAFQKQKVETLPVKIKSSGPTNRYMHYGVVRSSDSLLMRQRTGKGIWRNLWDFPAVESSDFILTDQSPTLLLEALQYGSLTLEYSGQKILHRLTHRVLHIHFHIFSSAVAFEPPEGCRWIGFEALGSVPVPVPVRDFLERARAQWLT